MSSIDLQRLLEACEDTGRDGGITITTELEPLGGPDATVKPATYAGGVFQTGRRWWGDGDARRVVEVISIDNEPSQANRLEAALLEHREVLGLPEFVLDLSELEPLPPHVPRRLSSFQFPHRNADAYLRDSALQGEKFVATDIGKAVFAATADRADALMTWMPQALLFGFWQSHLGKKGSQAKLARSWTSEIIGYEPAADDIRRKGLKGDPLNLSIDDPVQYDENFHGNWEISNKGKNLSDIGHGQVPVGGQDAALDGVSFRSIIQRSTVSFASLRRIRVEAGVAEARALLVALGLTAHAAAFGRTISLRSGAELRPTSSQWSWLGETGDQDLMAPSFDDAVSLLADARDAADSAGVPVDWQPPVVLTPLPNLQEAIRKTFPEPNED